MSAEGVGRRIRRSLGHRIGDLRGDMDLVEMGARAHSHLQRCDPCVKVAARGADKEDKRLLWVGHEADRAAARRVEATTRRADEERRRTEVSSRNVRRYW